MDHDEETFKITTSNKHGNKKTKIKNKIGKKKQKKNLRQGTHHADVVPNERTRLKTNGEPGQNTSWAEMK